MSIVTDLMTDLRNRGVRLWVDGEKLRFKAPEKALTPELMGRLKRHKEEVITFLSQGNRPQAGIRIAPRLSSMRPLSFAQQRMWFLHKMGKVGAAFHIAGAFRWCGPLDTTVLAQAVHGIIERHEILSTRITENDGQPVAEVVSDCTYQPRIIDYRGKGFTPDDPEVTALVAEEPLAPFDLSEPPLVRVTVIHLDDDDHVLMVTIHHIIADGWSMGIIVRELTALYGAGLQGKADASVLPPMPVQYADYAYDQRKRLEKGGLERQLDFWKDQLEGAPQVLDLPFDRPRPAVQTYNGADIPVMLNTAVTARLQQFCQDSGATPFVVLKTLFFMLLSRLSGQQDMVIGTPVAGRTREELASLIGLFVNTLALRLDISDNPTFRQLIDRTAKNTLTLFDNQDLPFDRVVEALDVPRNPSHSPVFQVMFAYQNTPGGSLEVEGVSLEPLEQPGSGAQVDLTLDLFEGVGRVNGLFRYNTDLFDSETIQGFAQAFQHLTMAALGNPDAPVDRLPLMTRAAQAQMVDRDSFGPEVTEEPATLLSLVRTQAEVRPHAVALMTDRAVITYEGMINRAAAIARHLIEKGLQPGDHVAVCLDKGPDAVTSFLAILAAGGVYIPLAVDTPKQRLSFLLNDCRPQFLMTETGIPFPEYQGQVVAPSHIGESDAVLPHRITATAPAYMIYTSGSTGNPKGVLVSHRNLAWFNQGIQRDMGAGPGDRLLQFASLNFDASLIDFCSALTTGAALVIGQRDAMMGDRLGDFLRAHRITHTWLSPSAASFLDGKLPDLRVLITGGEVQHKELVARLAPGRIMINSYGPTETTIGVVSNRSVPDQRQPPIGTKMAGVQGLVLDQLGNPVPAGVPGQLCIGGAYVARGYHDRPALTAEKFVPNPYTRLSGDRLYLTGDRVLMRHDGLLVYLGRLDHQVKLRGFRIELGEIEAVLMRHPLVAQAVALVRLDGDNQRLLAFFVPSEDIPGTEDLRTHMAEFLPEYMVPVVFTPLDSLPLTSGGKVDRKVLADWAVASPEHREATEPRDALEAQIAEIWGDVLGQQNIGVFANFFEMGGHSLNATQVISRIADQLGVALQVHQLFGAPTIAGVAELLRKEQGGTAVMPGIPVEPRIPGEPLPLSFAQQRLWFLDQLEGPSSVYNMPMSLKLEGALHVVVLEQALRAMADRHEVLRTRFPKVGGEPVQQIDSPGCFQLDILDLENVENREALLMQLVKTHAHRPFLMNEENLFNVVLLRLDAGNHVLLVNLHHIISDGWSMGVIVRELAAFYRAFMGETTPNLPALPVQYADFARWQRARVDNESLQAQETYWQQQLADVPPLLELPYDRARPAVQTFNGAAAYFQVQPQQVAALEALAKAQSGTLFMVLQAAWASLLARYSGNTDVVVGSPIANRNHKDLEPLIGFFVNTLALRTDLSGNPTFSELLDRVRHTALDAYANQDLPFEQVVELVGAQRNQSFSPLFQVMIILQNTSDGGGLQLPGLTLAPIGDAAGTAKFDMTLAFDPAPNGMLGGSLEYNTDLFDADTIERMIGHLQALLAALPGNPRPLQIDLMDDAERARILLQWAGDASLRAQAPITESIETVAESQPDAPAVESGQIVWTYQQLLERADALAGHLQQLGVGPESVVGIAMQRSAAQMAAVLAVFRAGGCCLPIDPAYPQERRDFMLTDSGVTVLICDMGDVPEMGDIQTLALDRDACSADMTEKPVSRFSLQLDHPAYMIYTSGSTGRPKGVMVTHRVMANLMAWQRTVLGESARTLQFASLSFDVSFQELITTWTTGGCLVMVDNDTRMDMAALLRLLQERAVSRLFLPFVALQQLAETAMAVERYPQALRDVITAGEQLHVTPAIAAFFKQVKARLHNHYGPSETHVGTALTMDGDALTWPELPAIGTPIDGAQAYVLDPFMQPTPSGVPGELFLGGQAPARGYADRPALTASRFVPDPFATTPGARLYRTGDRVRFLPDGNLAFLGRVDFQIKLRGFRVEPGEVESALATLSGVSQAAVVVREDTPGDRYLAAYVQPAEASSNREEVVRGLRDALKQSLPEYMVPASFTLLNAMPLTPSGKLDRRALPQPKREGSGRLLAPRNPNEARLAAIWAEVLKLDTVSVDANFFELGGHSLLATRVMTRIREEFGQDLPVRTLFGAPTVMDLTKHLQQGDRTGIPLPPITAVDRTKPLPLSHAQMRMWFLDRLGNGGSAFNLVDPLRLRGPLDVSALIWSLRQLVLRHEVLRLRVVAADGTAYACFDPTPDNVVTQVDLSQESEMAQKTAVQQLLEREAAFQFNLETGPLYRLSLIRLGDEDHVLLMNLHHMVSDGWSSGILTREFSVLYNAAVAQSASPLPELPLQYADYAAWQHEHLAGEALVQRVDYWRNQLADLSVLELPTDRPRPDMLTFAGGEEHLTLPGETGKQLQMLARQHNCSLFMVLMAAFHVLLARMSGQDDISVGSPIAGRNHEGTENLVGCFLNILVLRGDLTGDPTFLELLGRIRDMTLDAYEHQDVSFEQLLEELQPRRDLSRNPLFQVYFNLMNFGGGEADTGPLTMERVAAEVDATTTKFDLALYIMEHGDALGLRLIFNKVLFDRSTARTMLRRFRVLVDAITASPTHHLSTLPILEGTEADVICRPKEMPKPSKGPISFGGTDTSLGARFDQTATDYAQRLAVQDQDRSWTYAELQSRAAGITALLASYQGEHRVALLFEKRLVMTAALFGVLRAGLTYVPIDPNYPRDRKQIILEDADARLILCDAANAADARDLAGGRPVQVIHSEGSLETALCRQTPPHQPAYLLYTSGTTGKPKGVIQTHRNVLTHVRNYTQNLRICAEDKVSMLPGYSFDAAIMDFYGALLNGASLHLYDVLRDGFDGLADWIDQQQITVLHLTPTVFRHLVGSLSSERVFASVRMVVLGGEASVRADFEAYCRHFGPHCLLVNGLGPTESTLALQQILDHNSTFKGNRLPLGGPVDGLELILMNEHGEETADFAAGEIVLCGEQLALGYWKQPEATGKVFSKDQLGQRLYHTGDRARWTESGDLIFAGRRDDQLKIRGFRIEPAEIEARLALHESVKEVVVQPVERNGSPVLVAYVVSKHAVKPDPRELRLFAAAGLPDYMAPSAVVLMDALPQTEHGKLNRRALPEPSWRETTVFVPPKTETEQALVPIWEEVLRQEKISADANFFELGGHSLMAAQVITRVRDTFGVDLPIRVLFESSTIAALADQIDAATVTGDRPPLTPLPAGAPAPPASYSQQRLWFLNRLGQPSESYNMVNALHIGGSLDQGAMKNAVDMIVRRQQILRAYFALEDERLIMRFLPHDAVQLHILDVASEAEAKAVVETETAFSFDLEAGPLVRLTLMQLSPTDHIFCVVMHHTISDGWSQGLIVKELSSCYTAQREGKEPDLPALPIQYGDYAAWQHNLMTTGAMQQRLEWWRDHLQGAPPLLELPIDRPRPAAQTFPGALSPVHLAPALTERLDAFCRANGVTRYMALKAGLAALLARYSNQDDLVLGTVTANRDLSEVEPLIGFFVNTLAMRIDLSGNPNFQTLAARTRRTALAGFAHQDVPFDLVIEAVQPERSMSYTPLFQVMFVMQNGHADAPALSDLTLRPLEAWNGVSRFELTLNLSDTPHGIGGHWEYNTDLFDTETIERMTQRFLRLLDLALAAPQESLADLPLMDEAEKQQTLVTWNQTDRVHTEHPFVHHGIEAQHPDATAIIFIGGEHLTYGQLNRRANYLAHCLAEQGIGPEASVAICLPRGPEQVIAMLAVMKAGGTWLPLSRSQPEDRLNQILADAQPAAMISDEAWAEGIPTLVPERSETAEGPSVQLNSQQAAYIIYTSGSTGMPKGVVNSHAGLHNITCEWVRLNHFNAESRVLQVAETIFDACVIEIFPTLTRGGVLVMAEKEHVIPGAGMVALLQSQQISHILLVPSALAELPQADLPHLHTLIVGAEACPNHLATQWSEGRHFVNAYGPTEAAVATLAASYESGVDRIHIGRPLGNTRIYLLDSSGQPVPTGIAGEICIGGTNLARGYLNRPGQTAERFVPNPFDGQGQRLYRTGDLARMQNDGNLMFMGRIDHQVKLRGFRIELGEIETVLTHAPGVQQAVVLLQRNRLVAYLTGDAEPTEVRTFLQQSLPDYMVPAVLTMLETMPRTPGGKLDRRALAAMPVAEQTRTVFAPPETETEQQLANIWAEVLEIEEIGRDDNFFDLGGHSLLGAKVITRINEAFKTNMEVRSLFETKDLAGLAEVLDDLNMARGLMAETEMDDEETEDFEF